MCNLFIPPTAVFSIYQLFKLCKKLCDDQKTTLIQMYYKTLIQSWEKTFSLTQTGSLQVRDSDVADTSSLKP